MVDAPSVWMPIYWGDYHKKTAHLSAAEHGAYLLLIGHYWTTGEPLPDDGEKLRRIARMERSEWKRAKETLAAFFVVGNGVWVHERAEEELAEWASRKQKNSTRASTAASKRWARSGDATSMPQAVKNTCLDDALKGEGEGPYRGKTPVEVGVRGGDPLTPGEEFPFDPETGEVF